MENKVKIEDVVDRYRDKYKCQNCGKVGLISSFITDKDIITCPRCNSKKIEKT